MGKMEEEREMCQNCKKDIPVTNYRSHTLYCARNMVKCPDCDIMVAHGNENMELHRQEFHALRICDQCGVSIEAYKLPEHKKTLCSKRTLVCKYCGQGKLAMEMSDHETYCGSRTERCDRCPDWVQLREWDSHQSRYHSNVQRRFRERSVIAQTETIIEYNNNNAGGKHNENDKNVNNITSSNEPMLPCEFCDGLVPMRKLLEHQAACVNPTNVRRNDSSSSSSCTSSFRSTTKPQGLQKKLSCAEQITMESPVPSPSISKKAVNRKISAPAAPTCSESNFNKSMPVVEAENTNTSVSKTKVPCEFCNEPCSLEALMRHQRTCKKNPHINPQEVQQDAPSPYEKYTRRQRHYSLSRTQSVRETSTDLGRPLRALSRQNSFSSLRRSESFYSGNAHASMTLGRSAYSGTDYASAVRRTSLFDGYAGFSLYSSISQGLDEISYGGRRSRRGSISDTTTNTYSYASRRGSISTSVDYAALIAATNTVECATSNHQNNITKNEKHIVDQNIHPESGLGNSPKSINLSRQNSTRMSNMSDSAYGEDYEPSSPIVTAKQQHKIQKSTSLVATTTTAAPVKPHSTTSTSSSEVTVIKHSKSSGKLERKVSFSEADPVKIGGTGQQQQTHCEQGQHQQQQQPLPSKPKRSKDKKAHKDKHSKTANSKSSDTKKASPKDLSPKSESEFVDQVSAKLKVLEQQQKAAAEVTQQVNHNNNHLEISATVKLSPKSQPSRPKSQQSNPAITAILQDLVSPSSNEDNVESAKIREKASNCSRFGSKRNSLDKQSVQTLAQDLAAECAKAYALMESSLSKLSSDLGVTPFGLAPKSKKLRKSNSTTTASTRPQDATST